MVTDALDDTERPEWPEDAKDLERAEDAEGWPDVLRGHRRCTPRSALPSVTSNWP